MECINDALKKNSGSNVLGLVVNQLSSSNMLLRFIIEFMTMILTNVGTVHTAMSNLLNIQGIRDPRIRNDKIADRVVRLGLSARIERSVDPCKASENAFWYQRL